MANDKYLLNRKGEQAAHRDLARLFGVPSIVAVLVAGYFLFTLPNASASTLFIAVPVWFIFFTFMSEILESAPAASGTLGESRVQSSLKRLSDDYILFDTVRLPHPQSRTGERELDFVVIGKRRVFVIEVKNNAGTIAPPDVWDRQWPVVTQRGDKRSMRNPLRQAYGQRKTLEGRLAERGIHLKVQPIVVLSNPDCEFIYSGKVSIPIVMSGTDLREIITRFDRAGSEIDQSYVAEVIQSVDISRKAR